MKKRLNKKSLFFVLVIVIILVFFLESSDAWYFERDFNSGELEEKAEGSDGFSGTAGGSYYTSNVVYEGGQAAEMNVRKGESGFGYWGGSLGFPDLYKGDEFWFRVRTYFPSEFDYTASPRLKFLRLHTATGEGSNAGYNDIYINPLDSEDSPFKGIKEGHNQWYDFGNDSHDIVYDKWETYDFYVKLDDVNSDDGGGGVMRFWKDGELLGEFSGIESLGGEDHYANYFYLFTYWNSDPFTRAYVSEDGTGYNFVEGEDVLVNGEPRSFRVTEIRSENDLVIYSYLRGSGNLNISVGDMITGAESGADFLVSEVLMQYPSKDQHIYVDDIIYTNETPQNIDTEGNPLISSADSSHPGCLEGKITETCFCGNNAYWAGYCCNDVWFDPSYEESGGCPQGDFYYLDNQDSLASDSNPGTENMPWKTLKKATETVTSGDVVIVKEGTYVASDPSSTHPYDAFEPENSGTVNNPITFKSEPVLAATIERNSTDYLAWGISEKNYITIDGFHIKGGLRVEGEGFVIKNCELIWGWYPPHDTSLNWGLALHGASNSLIKNNYVHSMEDSGNNGHNSACLHVHGDSDNNIIEKNTVDAGNGIVYSAYGTKGGGMDYNVWRYNLGTNAITGFLGMGSTDGTINTTYNDLYQNIIIDSTYGVELYKLCEYFDIYNNVFDGTERGLRAVKTTSDYNNLWNNIFNSSDRIFFWSGYADGDNPESFTGLLDYSDYQCFDGSYSHIAMIEASPTTYFTELSNWQNDGWGVNSIEYAPLFMNPGGNNPEDYKLQSGSHALNAGIDRQDYDSDENTIENINMGAYITGDEQIGYRDLSYYLANASSGPENQTQTYHPADINPQNGVISFIEIEAYMNRWLNGEITINQLLDGINEWRDFD